MGIATDMFRAGEVAGRLVRDGERGVRMGARMERHYRQGQVRAAQLHEQVGQAMGAARGTVAVRTAGTMAGQRGARPIRGDRLLNFTDAWIGKHVHMRDAGRHSVTMWAVAQHFRRPVQPCGTGAQQRIRMVMVWDKFGRIMLVAETPGSGKTTLGTTLGYLCAPYFHGPLANPTAPGLCLTIAHEDAMVFIDEAHRLVGPRGTRKADVITIACAGIDADATYLNGKGGKANRVPIYAAMIIAGRDDLVKSAGEEIADLIDRSVLIRMTQPPEDIGEELLPVTAQTKADGARIAGEMAQWAAWQMADVPRFRAAVGRARQAARDTGLRGRSADVWLPMLTVAALADLDRAEGERQDGDEPGEDGYPVLPEGEDGHLGAACEAAVELRLRRPARQEDEDPLGDLEAMIADGGMVPSWGRRAVVPDEDAVRRDDPSAGFWDGLGSEEE